MLLWPESKRHLAGDSRKIISSFVFLLTRTDSPKEDLFLPAEHRAYGVTGLARLPACPALLRTQQPQVFAASGGIGPLPGTP